MYAPHFEVQGIYHPSRHQQETVFLHNKTQMEELHAAANRAIKKLVQTKTEDTEGCFAELLVVTKEWQEWAKDPIGNSLRAGMALPQPPPPPPLLAPAPVPAMVPPANSTATPSPVSSHPQNEAKKEKKKGKGKPKGKCVDPSSPGAPAMGPALMALTLEMSTPVPDTAPRNVARTGKKKTKPRRLNQARVIPSDSLPSPSEPRLVPAWFLAGVPKLPTADETQTPKKSCGRNRKQPKLANTPASSRSNSKAANTMPAPARNRSLPDIGPQPLLNVTRQKDPSSSDSRRRPTNPVQTSQSYKTRINPVEPASANTSVAAAKSMQSHEIPTQPYSWKSKPGLQTPPQPRPDPTNDTFRQPLPLKAHRVNARALINANETKAPNKSRVCPAPISTGVSGLSNPSVGQGT
ncbi:hypothetical protein BDV97DRAFT_345024 [Delphinella strobiligena]|nr:hypothetical protein BDV97DRAFT_345024 [Delphinella strobiligena]